MNIEMSKYKKDIEYLLSDESGVSRYRISKDTGIPQTTLAKYKDSEKIGGMGLDIAIKLHNYFIEEMDKMAAVKKVVYTVEVTSTPGSPYPDVLKKVNGSENEAKEIAEKLATEHPDKQVYVTFFRRRDSQTLFLNRDGYDLIGQSWTDVDA